MPWYTTVCLPKVMTAIDSQREKTDVRGILLHHDNLIVHHLTTQSGLVSFLENPGLKTLPHPPYSPDIRGALTLQSSGESPLSPLGGLYQTIYLYKSTKSEVGPLEKSTKWAPIGAPNFGSELVWGPDRFPLRSHCERNGNFPRWAPLARMPLQDIAPWLFDYVEDFRLMKK